MLFKNSRILKISCLAFQLTNVIYWMWTYKPQCYSLWFSLKNKKYHLPIKFSLWLFLGTSIQPTEIKKYQQRVLRLIDCLVTHEKIYVSLNSFSPFKSPGQDEIFPGQKFTPHHEHIAIIACITTASDKFKPVSSHLASQCFRWHNTSVGLLSACLICDNKSLLRVCFSEVNV